MEAAVFPVTPSGHRVEAAAASGKKGSSTQASPAAPSPWRRRNSQNFHRDRGSCGKNEKICKWTHRPPHPRPKANRGKEAPNWAPSRQPAVTSARKEGRAAAFPGSMPRSRRKRVRGRNSPASRHRERTTENTMTKAHRTAMALPAPVTEFTKGDGEGGWGLEAALGADLGAVNRRSSPSSSPEAVTARSSTGPA